MPKQTDTLQLMIDLILPIV